MSKPILTINVKPGGQLELKTKNALEQDVVISMGEKVKSQNAFNWSVVVGLPAVFKVVNRHFTDVYTVITSNGTVSMVDDTITYTPATLGQGGFMVNGTYFALTVIADKVGKPVLTAPSNNAANLNTTPVLISSSFQAQNSAISHTQSRWQIATDAGFTNLVLDTTDSLHLTSFISKKLNNSTQYFARVMHIGTKP